MALSVREVIQSQNRQKDRLLEVLRELQDERNCLSQEVLAQVAEEMDLPLSHVYGVATFYSLYAVRPRGKYIIRICENAPCHIRGAQAVIDAFMEALGISMNETTKDGRFSLEFTSCLGVCGVAPAVMINSTIHGNLTPESILEILAQYR